MYPATIESYLAPVNLAEAFAALETHSDAVIVAGGQSLMQAIKARLIQPRVIVDLGRVDELRGIKKGPAGIRIGGLTRYRAIHEETMLLSAYEALIDAASHVGDRQVRNRGTIGGSVCWNYVAACMPPTTIAVGAVFELAAAPNKVRQLPAEDFLKGPLETDLQPGEILTAVLLPPAPLYTGSAYQKWGLGTDALPIVGIGALVELDQTGRCRRARVAVGGLASGPKRTTRAEALLTGAAAGDLDTIRTAVESAADQADPQSDHAASSEYRKVLIRAMGEDVLLRAFARAGAIR